MSIWWLVLGLIVFLALFMWVYSIGELNESFDAEMFKKKRLNWYIENQYPARIRYLGQKRKIPIAIDNREYAFAYISRNINGNIILHFRNEATWTYENEDDFFEEWRLVKDDEEDL